MAAQSGPAVAAMRAAQAELSERLATAAATDRLVTAALRDAHRGAVTAGRHLDAIAAEITAGVDRHDGFAADTPLGAREFQRMLIARQRELIAVVAEAQRAAAAGQALLGSLRARYPAAAQPE